MGEVVKFLRIKNLLTSCGQARARGGGGRGETKTWRKGGKRGREGRAINLTFHLA